MRKRRVFNQLNKKNFSEALEIVTGMSDGDLDHTISNSPMITR
jgi:hypothetical protein